MPLSNDHKSLAPNQTEKLLLYFGLLRRPCVIVRTHLWTLPRAQKRAIRPICVYSACEVPLMRHLPLLGLILSINRRNICSMMHPSMPTWRYHRCLGISIIDHPAPSAFFLSIINITKFIFTNSYTLAGRKESSAHGLMIPPSKHFKKKLLHIATFSQALGPQRVSMQSQYLELSNIYHGRPKTTTPRTLINSFSQQFHSTQLQWAKKSILTHRLLESGYPHNPQTPYSLGSYWLCWVFNTTNFAEWFRGRPC